MINRRVLNFLTTKYWQLMGVKVGEKSIIERGFKTNCPKKIEIGRNCLISQKTVVTTELLQNEAKLKIEDNVQINKNVKLDITGGILIKEGTLISSNSILFTHSHGLDPRSQPNPIPLQIGNNVWVGERVTILHNVSNLNDNMIIGSGAIIAKDYNEEGIIVVSGQNRIISRD